MLIVIKNLPLPLDVPVLTISSNDNIKLSYFRPVVLALTFLVCISFWIGVIA